MRLADAAMLARTSGDTDLAVSLTKQAFENERQAADQVAADFSFEPTRSVLHRSAATLAVECNELREAERLIGRALAGNPPASIADELRDLLEDVYFRRHLAVRGVTLAEDEFQLSLEGSAVGFGIAPSDAFVGRVRQIETLLYRVAERHLGKPFRDAGRRKKRLAEDLELYVSVPRAASFAVSFKVGQSTQLSLPGVDLAREVIEDFLHSIDLLNRGDIGELKKQIPDDSYFRNFVALAQAIAPDGERVRTVGFTAREHGHERQVVLSRPKNRIGPESAEPDTRGRELVEVRGLLLAADARKQKEGRIEVVDDRGNTHHVRVPRGMMSDIVKPMFEERVIVQGRVDGNQLVLEEIGIEEESTDG